MRSAGVSVFSRITAYSALFYLFCEVVFAYVLSYAWVADDAYTTFRVVDNFVHGYGLRWNVDERVQVYTHPLWMLLHIPFYAVFGNIFLVTIGISAVIGAAAVATVLRCGKASYLQKALLVLLPLALSTSFCQFAVSGLEVPLSLFLLGLFFYYFISFPASVYRLLCIASLAVLTRFDNIMILLPALCWLAVNNRKTININRALVAVSPLIGWCLFSLFYYGFVFPNTKYAKLDTGIPQAVYCLQGLRYIENWMRFDPGAFFWGVVAMAVCLYKLFVTSGKGRETSAVSPSFYAVALAGIALHVVYVFMIGGDFMSGRFFMTPFFLAVLTVYLFSTTISYSPAFILITYMAAYFTTVEVTPLPVVQPGSGLDFGIVNEPTWYRGNFLIRDHEFQREPVYAREGQGTKVAQDPGVIQDGYIVEKHTIGMYGYYAGPKVRIIDELAIADPLLARLPAIGGRMPRIGHINRRIPDGYEYARKTGDLSNMDPNLAKYYAKLRLVISDPLFSLHRIKTIVGFQLGWYDGWRDHYLNDE